MKRKHTPVRAGKTYPNLYAMRDWNGVNPDGTIRTNAQVRADMADKLTTEELVNTLNTLATLNSLVSAAFPRK